VAQFGITSERRGFFFLSGELDMETAPLMGGAMELACAQGGPITVDMTDVSFVDSAGIQAIVQLLESLPFGCIVLHGVQRAVGTVLDIVGADRLPNLHIIRCSLGGERSISELTTVTG
jgi:anti-anti-sigma factor